MITSLQAQQLKHKNIHIMGLGWLGLAVTDTLLEYNARVSGSVTSIEKQDSLQSASLSVDVFNLYTPVSEQSTNKQQALASRFNNATLLLNIPPGRKDFHKGTFVANMTALIDYAMDHGLQQLIFISTTSVFGEQHTVVNNDTALSPKTESGKAHQAIEAYLSKHYLSMSKIVRPSGLIGPNSIQTVESHPKRHKTRHPIHTLCHKTDIPNGRDPVNLIHQFDVIQAILALLTKSVDSHAFNLSALQHPSRQEYYQWCAQQLSLPIPGFATDTKKRQLGKLIDATSSFTELGFTPKYSSPYSML